MTIGTIIRISVGVYLFVGIIVAFLCNYFYICADFDISDEDFWMCVIVALFWPIGGIIVIILIIRENRIDIVDNINIENKIEENVVVTKFVCPNCGDHIKKISDKENEEYIFKCYACGINYTKKDLLNISIQEGQISKDNTLSISELTDFEEEYFEACEIFNFRPYNKHSDGQIERQYEKLQSLEFNGEIEFYDIDTLDNTYDYFQEEQETINDYFSKYSEAEIKERYEFYKLLYNEE